MFRVSQIAGRQGATLVSRLAVALRRMRVRLSGDPFRHACTQLILYAFATAGMRAFRCCVQSSLARLRSVDSLEGILAACCYGVSSCSKVKSCSILTVLWPAGRL